MSEGKSGFIKRKMKMNFSNIEKNEPEDDI